METKLQKQCKDYIRPLFKLCKRKEVNHDILIPLTDMVKCCEEGNNLPRYKYKLHYLHYRLEVKFIRFLYLCIFLHLIFGTGDFLKANDHYLRCAIGNAGKLTVAIYI